jgi:hypothetical protein
MRVNYIHYLILNKKNYLNCGRAGGIELAKEAILGKDDDDGELSGVLSTALIGSRVS